MEYIHWLLVISCKTAKYIISNKIYSCLYCLLQLIKGLKSHMWHISNFYSMLLLWLLANSKHILKTKNMDITLELIRKKSHSSLPGTLTRESKFTWQQALQMICLNITVWGALLQLFSYTAALDPMKLFRHKKLFDDKSEYKRSC